MRLTNNIASYMSGMEHDYIFGTKILRKELIKTKITIRLIDAQLIKLSSSFMALRFWPPTIVIHDENFIDPISVGSLIGKML